MKTTPKQELFQNLEFYLDFSLNRRTPAGLLIILTAVWQYRGE
jgi:hypothetical protein